MGIGVVPESWTYFSPIQAKRSSFAGSDGQTGVGYNWYFDGAYKYIANDYALAYQQNATSGVHSWSTAASGTADNTISWSERMRIDSSGNLLVGKSSTAFGTAGVEASASNGLWSTRSGLPALALNRLSTDGSIADFYKDGSSVGSIGGGATFLTIGSGTTNLFFQNSIIGPTASSSGATSNGVIDLGTAGTRFKDLYLSGGAYLGGTGAANKLDDYEEGTFTPTSGVGLTITTNCNYVKVGRLVHVTYDVTFANSSSGSSAYISLPFTPTTYNSGVVGWHDATTLGTLVNHAASVGIYFVAQNAPNNSIPYSYLASKRVIGAMTYYTTA